jgi:hypothetical protein
MYRMMGWMVLAVAVAMPSVGCAATPSAYDAWARGPSKDPSYFPITVWLQDPASAPKYQALGFNTIVGLWKGPTEEQLATLKKHNMKIICEQNEVGLKHLADPTIIAWMHGDEPDNAQSDGKGGYGPPVATEKIIADYQRIKKNDPSRPVMLNLGQGVAWDKWHGRGVRTNHPEDYAEYVKGGDIISFDIYPVNASHPDVKEKLHLVPFGIDRLRQWTKDEKPVWCCYEVTQMGKDGRKPTPHEVKAEIWMSLIHGAKGLIYFVHIFQPKFNEAGLLADAEMTQAVGAINKQILELAPALNSPTVADGATVASSNADVPVDVMVKQLKGVTYLFAVGMRKGDTKTTFTVKGIEKGTVEVIGENRKLTIEGGQFTDDFKAYDVRLYKITK